MGEHTGHGADTWHWVLALPLLMLTAGYLLAVLFGRRRGRPWPATRTGLCLAGGALCLAAVLGPLAEAGRNSFPAHMVGHLLISVFGPLLVVLSAPATVAVRALPVPAARALVRLLNSHPIRFVSHPVTAGVLSLGGMAALYGTRLYAMSQAEPLLQVAVHAHFIVAGYLFTAAIIAVDPQRHRASFRLRAAVLVIFAAGHGVLAKLIYAYPPPGVPPGQAEVGAMVMFYGNDLAELAMAVILCHSWYAGRARAGSSGRIAPSSVTPVTPGS